MHPVQQPGCSHLKRQRCSALQGPNVPLMHSWSHQAAKLLFGLAAAGIACHAVAEAAEERLNPGDDQTALLQ